jgi:hypothetical protein
MVAGGRVAPFHYWRGWMRVREGPFVLKVDYFWGTYERVADIDHSTARIAGVLTHPRIPLYVHDGLIRERIAKLGGDYGDSAVGEPIEVDVLDIEIDQDTIRLRVFNRGLVLALGGDDEVKRLHRFIGAVRKALESSGR